MKKRKLLQAVLMVLFLAGIVPAQAGTKTWSAGTGDWFVNANWGGNPYPTNGDDVVITNAGASVLLTNSTASLSSLTLSKTLVFSNWNTKLSVTNVTIQTGGNVTLPGAFTNVSAANRVYIVCSSLMIAAGGKIDANTNGYAGGGPTLPGYGPGAGNGTAGYGSGGGYGGYGGPSETFAYGGSPYGSASQPMDPGSGGGCGFYGHAGNGGGAIQIQASGTVTVHGAITANGGGYYEQALSGGGGSGGSIFITCRVLAGTNGLITANGGNSDGNLMGSGGGGRIAVQYDPAAQSAAPVPTIRFYLIPGKGYPATAAIVYPGDIGTLYLPDTQCVNPALLPGAEIIVPGFVSWSLPSLTVSNWVRFPADGFQLVVTQNLEIAGADARMELGGPALKNNAYMPVHYGTSAPPGLTVGGNLMLTNAGSLVIYSAPTNGGTQNYGALVRITGDTMIGNGSWIYPQSHPTNGGSVLFLTKNLTISTNAGFDAYGRGYSGSFSNDNNYQGYGPGGGAGSAGSYAGSGGYGGVGGKGLGSSGLIGGDTYGSSNTPFQAGSGGAVGQSLVPGGSGGGVIWIKADRVITLNGALKADGQIHRHQYSGTGSGGSIYLTSRTFAGSSTASLSAKGGDINPVYVSAISGGGGGRIAVWRINDISSGQAATNVAAGNGDASGYGARKPAPGTIVWGWMPAPGAIISGR